MLNALCSGDKSGVFLADVSVVFDEVFHRLSLFSPGPLAHLPEDALIPLDMFSGFVQVPGKSVSQFFRDHTRNFVMVEPMCGRRQGVPLSARSFHGLALFLLDATIRPPKDGFDTVRMFFGRSQVLRKSIS